MGPRPTSRREAELPAGPEGQPGGAAALLGRGFLPGGRHLGQRPGQSHPGLREALQAQRTGMVSAGGVRLCAPNAVTLCGSGGTVGRPHPHCLPCRYLVSVMETFLLYKHFQESPAVPSARQELADFWLGFLLTSCQPFVPEPRCPVGSSPGGWGTGGGTWGDRVWWLQVLILEHGKVLRPARLAVRGAAEEPAVMLSLVCPMEEVGPGLGSCWGGPAGRPPPTPSPSSCRKRCPAGNSHPQPSGASGERVPNPPYPGCCAPAPLLMGGDGGVLFLAASARATSGAASSTWYTWRRTSSCTSPPSSTASGERGAQGPHVAFGVRRTPNIPPWEQ